jgi:hypothetical protein
MIRCSCKHVPDLYAWLTFARLRVCAERCDFAEERDMKDLLGYEPHRTGRLGAPMCPFGRLFDPAVEAQY